jgi:short-subunit dehydrogenase
MATSLQLKPIKDQTIVITGASSGIGLTTARMAAKEGARLVLAARNEDALRQLEQEINSGGAGAQAVAVRADVGNEEDIRNVARTAVERFGGFDTWINNAGVGMYGRIEQTPTEDMRRLFDTNYWGMVYGSKAAVEHFKTRSEGAVLINVGSTVSDRAIPLQGIYSASKFAVRGFTDALRMEVEEAGYPISVTLIKPAAIDTPYTEHARNLMEDADPDFPPPVYAPEVVARAILHAATHPQRDISVGGASKLFNIAEKYAPRLTDKYMEKTMFAQQRKNVGHGGARVGHTGRGLHEPGRGLAQRGDYPGHVAKTSLYTQASTHPWITGAILGAAGVAVAALVGGASKMRERDRSWFQWE